MTIDDICQWLQNTLGVPAPPTKAAEEINKCSTTMPTLTQWKNLEQSIEARFYNARRKQFTEQQMQAIHEAATFGRAGGLNANSFRNLSRARIAFQLIARVIDPTMVHQGPVQLCGPAAIVVSLAKTQPMNYVLACTKLADHGQTVIGNWMIQPSSLIRNHASTKEADWVLCASIRADDRAISDKMYGTSGAHHIFEWLVNCGYGKVIIANHFPLRLVKAQPAGLLPPGLDASDKLALVHAMADLAQRGWVIILLAFGAMPVSMQSADKARQSLLDAQTLMGASAQDAEAQYAKAMERVQVNLTTENPSMLSMGWDALTGNAAAHTMHVTFLGSVQIIGTEIKLNCTNFGEAQRWITLPINDFVHKFAGFAAATDVG